jgi:hypothetical protein
LEWDALGEAELATVQAGPVEATVGATVGATAMVGEKLMKVVTATAQEPVLVKVLAREERMDNIYSKTILPYTLTKSGSYYAT